MRVRNEVPVWALLFSVPVALLAINCGPANLDTENADKSEQVVGEKAMDMNMDASMDMAASNDQMATDADSLNMNDEGSSDSWHGRRWGGRGYWGGGYRGYYRGYGYGYGLPYGYSLPYGYTNPWWLY